MPPFRPHRLDPQTISARVALVNKNFSAVSHIGLGVSALNTSKVLTSEGIWSEAWSAQTYPEVRTKLDSIQNNAIKNNDTRVSHVVIMAPWLSSQQIMELCCAHPTTQFACISHSNVAFLQADRNGIKLLREYAHLTDGMHNFEIGGNSQRFVTWAKRSLNPKAVFLPNLYDLNGMREVGARPPWRGSEPLRVGLFGAARPLKNCVTAGAAAIELAERLKTVVELSVSTGRVEAGQEALNALHELIDNRKNVKIIHTGWESWPQFRQTVAHQHVLMQPSFTESFNMVTADGIFMGVASAVSDAIDWVPSSWIAQADNASDLARVTQSLLHDPHAVEEGQQALRKFVDLGLLQWKRWLGIDG